MREFADLLKLGGTIMVKMTGPVLPKKFPEDAKAAGFELIDSGAPTGGEGWDLALVRPDWTVVRGRWSGHMLFAAALAHPTPDTHCVDYGKFIAGRDDFRINGSERK